MGCFPAWPQNSSHAICSLLTFRLVARCLGDFLYLKLNDLLCFQFYSVFQNVISIDSGKIDRNRTTNIQEKGIRIDRLCKNPLKNSKYHDLR